MRTVVLYGRDGCCLCEEARQVLMRVRARLPFALQERDIEQDDALHRAYLERIPVVTIDAVEAFELFVDEGELERRLSAPGLPIPDPGLPIPDPGLPIPDPDVPIPDPGLPIPDPGPPIPNQ